MPRLVLINGAPGMGKSTLARRYADEHPPTLGLDIDVVRGMIGSWLDDPQRAGVLARRMAVEMARVHLASGHDVLVPQFLGRVDFVVDLERLAREVGAEFVEVVIVSDADDSDSLVDRFVRRSSDPSRPEHRDAHALLERSGGESALPAMHEALLRVVAVRPRTRRVRTVDGAVEETYRRLLDALG